MWNKMWGLHIYIYLCICMYTMDSVHFHVNPNTSTYEKAQSSAGALTSSPLRLVSSEQKGNVSPKWKQAVLAQGTRMNSAPHHNAPTVSWTLTHFLCPSETHTTSKEQIMPRAFKAPRLKGTFQQLEKTLHYRNSEKPQRGAGFLGSRHGNSPFEGITPFRESRRWRRGNQSPAKAWSSNIHPSSTAGHTGALFSHAVAAHQRANPAPAPRSTKSLLCYFKQSEVSQLMEDRAIGPQLFLIDWNDGWS